MTQLVFALVVTMGAQTISIEHWSGVERFASGTPSS